MISLKSAVFSLLFLISIKAVGDEPLPFVFKAQQSQLWLNPEWSILNYYDENLTSKIRGDHFLAADGNHNAKSELLKTVELMFYSAPNIQRQTQCKYMLRRDFLARNLGIPKEQQWDCPEFEDFYRKLAANEIYLVFASSFLQNPSSTFGHVLLKFKSERSLGNELIDYGINFSARTGSDSGALYALKGLFGYFPATYGFAPYHLLIKEYTDLDGRDIWELKLNYSPLEIRKILQHVWEMEGRYFDYYYLDDNCAYFILKLLMVARPQLDLVNNEELWVTPKEALEKVYDQQITTVAKYRSSLKSEFYQRKNLIDKEPEKLFSNLDNLNSAELEFLQIYSAIKLSGDSENRHYKELSYTLAKLRSKRTDRNYFSVQEPQLSSLTSKSLKWNLGLGIRGQNPTAKFGFRLLQRSFLDDEPTLTWSALEVLKFDFEANNQNQYYLKKLEVLNVQSRPPSNYYFSDWSWGINLGMESELSHSEALVGFLDANAGKSYDLCEGLDCRFSVLLNLSVWQKYFYPGINLGYLMQLSPDWKLSSEFKYFDSKKYQASMNFRYLINSDHSVGLEISHNQLSRDNESDISERAYFVKWMF